MDRFARVKNTNKEVIQNKRADSSRVENLCLVKAYSNFARAKQEHKNKNAKQIKKRRPPSKAKAGNRGVCILKDPSPDQWQYRTFLFCAAKSQVS